MGKFVKKEKLNIALLPQFFTQEKPDKKWWKIIFAFLEKKVKVNVRNFFQGSFRPLAQSTGLTKQRQINFLNTSILDTHDKT